MTESTDRGFRRMRGQVTPVQDAAVVVALGFVVIGVLGFLPGVTTGFGGMEFAGRESSAELFGVFRVSVLRNLVFIAVGVVGAFMSWFLRGAVAFLLLGGALYLLLGVYGLFVSGEDAANFLPADTADDLLHLGLGLAMLVLLLVMPRRPVGRGARPDTADGRA